VVTLFDYLTVACFLATAAAFFMRTALHPRTLLHALLACAALAVANQLGNAGFIVFGSILMATGIGYAIMIIRTSE
jgi:hypothetical protein